MNRKKQELDLSKFKKQKQVISKQQKPTSSHNTICTICDSNCHVGCGLSETTVKGSDIFRGCSAMSGENCRECTHHYTTHVHLRTMWVKVENEIDVLDKEQNELVERASKDIAAKEQLLNSLKISVDSCEKQITNKRVEIRRLINQMKSICSEFNYAKEIDLSITLVEQQIEYQQSQKNDDGVLAAQMVLKSFGELKKLVSGME